MNKQDLHALAKKTRVLINTVGPYHRHGEPVVEACAANGTHYLDVTGESPWVREMIDKYHKTAQASGAIIIPQIGVESAPADLTCYALASYLRAASASPTREIVFTVHTLKAAPSGGTLATVFGILDHYPLSYVMQSSTPTALCPVPTPEPTYTPGLLTRLTGVRQVRDLGTLTTSLQGGADATIVYRSWGLLSTTGLGASYGPRFQFSPYMTVRNSLVGLLTHLALAVGMLALVIPPLRWTLARLVTQAGSGPTKEDGAREILEYRAVATPDSEARQRAFARLRWEGSLYKLTGIFLAEGAATILQDGETAAKKLGGGVLTPATLGHGLLDRLKKVGVVFETKMLNH